MKSKLRGVFLLTTICALLVTIPLVAFSKGAAAPFSDVAETQWYYDAICYVYENGLMNGTSDSTFSPNQATSRGMVVTLLHRLEGEPRTAASSFTDVMGGAYYEQAVAWATQSHIVDGYGNGKFGPDDPITREQLAAILFRYVAYKGGGQENFSSYEAFNDASNVSDYAVEAMKWAVGNNLITGTSAQTLEPQGTALRSQLAAILMRFCETVMPSNEGVLPEGDIQTDDSREPGAGEEAGGNTPSTGNFTIEVGSVTAQPGQQAVIPITLSHNPGMLGLILSLHYDDTLMTLTGVENGTAVKDTLVLTPAGQLTSGCSFLWDGVDLTDEQIQDGELLLLRFDISVDAPAGSSVISITCRTGDAVDRDLKPLTPVLKGGTLTVTSG